MKWTEIKFAFSLCLTGGFFGCCYLANFNPLFCYLAFLMAGVVLGVVANATMRDIEESRRQREVDAITGVGRLMSFLPDEGKLDMVRKLRDLMKARQDRGDYSLQAAEPDVFRVDNDNLWFVVNQGDHFAFKDPEFPGVTVVMSSEFAMRALALGFLPAFPPPPKKKRVDACS